MNRSELILLDRNDYAEFTSEMQKAFPLGYEAEFGPCNTVILPELRREQRSVEAGECAGEKLSDLFGMYL